MGIEASGVCHSDWNVLTGATSHPMPVVLGHEGAGVVEEVGTAVSSVRPGDRVVLSWLPSCGRCFYCTRGRPSLCAESMPAMLDGTLPGGGLRLGVDGAPLHHWSFLSTFAEAAVVAEASCVPIPDDVPATVACLVGCGVMTGIGAVVHRADVEAGSTVAVFGAGGVGLSAILGARLRGAGQIVAIDPIASKRSLALSIGATRAVDPAKEDVVEVLRSLTAGRGADSAVEAAGAPGLVAVAYEALRPGGTLVCVGIPPEGVEACLPGPTLPRSEKTVVGSLYGSCRPHLDMPWVLDLYRQGRLDLDSLVTRTYPLEEVNLAFADLEAGEVARGVLILDPLARAGGITSGTLGD